MSSICRGGRAARRTHDEGVALAAQVNAVEHEVDLERAIGQPAARRVLAPPNVRLLGDGLEVLALGDLRDRGGHRAGRHAHAARTRTRTRAHTCLKRALRIEMAGTP